MKRLRHLLTVLTMAATLGGAGCGGDYGDDRGGDTPTPTPPPTGNTPPPAQVSTFEGFIIDQIVNHTGEDNAPVAIDPSLPASEDPSAYDELFD